MRVTLVTLFPDQLKQMLEKGILLRAIEANRIQISYCDLRQFGVPPHNKVDDYPFGEKKGMLIRADVLDAAIKSIPNYRSATMIYPCPKGQVFTQKHVQTFSEKKDLILICGYYEGIDERIFTLYPIQRISCGEFILTSGELPALTILDAVFRSIPGVLGNPKSFQDDSIVSGVLEHPQYTQPRIYQGLAVPEVVTSGNHLKRGQWERRCQLKTTLFSKPALLIQTPLSKADKQTLTDILQEG